MSAHDSTNPVLSNIEREIVALEERLAELKRDREDVIRLAGKYGLTVNGVLLSLDAKNYDFSKIPLRACLKQIMSDIRRPVRISELAKIIKDGGYNSAMSDIRGPIFNMFSRMVKNGEVRKVGAGLYELVVG